MSTESAQMTPISQFTLSMPLQAEYISTAAILGRTFCECLSLVKDSSDFAKTVELATSEACTNAVKHADSVSHGAVFNITYELFTDSLTIHVEGPGPEFDPTAVPAPDLDEHQTGGYGLFIIKEIMDEVSFSRSGGCNLLTMTKYLKHCKESRQ